MSFTINEVFTVTEHESWEAFLIGQLIGIVFGSLIGAILLRVAAKWVTKESVPYGDAYFSVLLTTAINTMLGFFVGFIVGLVTHSSNNVIIAALLMLPVGFLIQSGIIASWTKTRFRSACLISLVMDALGIGIAVLFGGIVILLSLIWA